MIEPLHWKFVAEYLSNDFCLAKKVIYNYLKFTEICNTLACIYPTDEKH